MSIIDWAFANPDNAVLILGGLLAFVIVTAFNQIGKPKVNKRKD